MVEEGGRGKRWVYMLTRLTPNALAISTPDEVAEAMKLSETVADTARLQLSTVNPLMSEV